MNIGSLRHRIILQDLVIIPNTLGEGEETWVDRGTIWAEIRPLRGNEFWMAQQVNSKITHKITTRYYQNIDSVNRLKFGDRLFEIISVINPDERCSELNFLCEEVTSSD